MKTRQNSSLMRNSMKKET